MKRNFFFILGFIAVLACSDDNSPATEAIDGNKLLEQASMPLNTAAIDSLLDRIDNSRYVLLGEASHGTAEFYTWRAEISKRLIQEKGFSVIAVEGDWPDLYRFNEYITGTSGASAANVLSQLDRWPSWMWANQEVAELGEWLKAHNASVGNEQQVNFYGLDVYSLWDSMREVLKYLESVDPASAQLAKNAIACFAPYEQQDEFAYAQDKTRNKVECADELAALLENVRQRVAGQSTVDSQLFNALQNAETAVNAERYYVSAIASNNESWNIRDRHMAETVNRVLTQKGSDAKIIIWAHNTHVGDARATTMKDEGMVNIGQLIREEHSNEGVYVVGFGTYTGTVIAASSWGNTLQKLSVPPAVSNSWEALLHNTRAADKIVFLKTLRENNQYMKRIDQRAIGVVYNPSFEEGNYVPSVLPDRYDVFVFIDKTQALHPLSGSSSSRKAARRIQD